MSIAKSYMQVLNILVNKETYLLGLTATPEAQIFDENKKLANFYHKQKLLLMSKVIKPCTFFTRQRLFS